jgi:hypothetical protein
MAAGRCAVSALDDIVKILSFPLPGVDSNNGSEFINHDLLTWCSDRQITITRSRPGNSNNGAPGEPKTWALVGTFVGYHRYNTLAELLTLTTSKATAGRTPSSDHRHARIRPSVNEAS